MRIDSSGNVGIGTSSPVGSLHVSTGSSGTTASAGYNEIVIEGGNEDIGMVFLSPAANNRTQTIAFGDSNNNSSGEIAYEHANDAMSFDTAGSERMRIDSSGNVGIGTSSPDKMLTLEANNNGTAGFPNNVLRFKDSDTTTVSDQSAGAIEWYTSDTDNGGAGVIGKIEAKAEGTGASYGMRFYTGNVNNFGEAMRIFSDGNLLVGYTSSNGAYKLQVNSQIFATSATIATSDGNYKKNITPLDGALSLVSQLNPVQFDWKEHPVHEFDRNQPTIGFIAQEVQQVLAEQPYLNSIVKSNECVLEPEETDDEGNVIKEAVTEPFLGIAEGNMVALLTAAIKEQQATITALEARIAALEAN